MSELSKDQLEEARKFLSKEHNVKYVKIHVVGWTSSSAVYENALRWDICGRGETKLKAEMDLLKSVKKKLSEYPFNYENVTDDFAYRWVNKKIKEDGPYTHQTHDEMRCTCGSHDYNDCQWILNDYKKSGIA